MGQNVNYLLGGQNQLLGADPELYRQQLIQQEQQRIAAMPQQTQLGAQVGSLLGRGIANVFQDRNFFEVTNPVLQKLTKIQDVYDTSMRQADPNDPLSFYTTLQKNFAEAGLGQQAMMASVEMKKFEDSNLKSEQLKTQVYKENPQLLDAQIAKAREAGDDTLANRLAEQRGQIQVKLDMDRSKEAAQIGLIGAQTAQAKAAAANYATQAADNKVSVTSIPDGNGGATIIYADKQTGKEVNRISVTSAVVDEYLKKKGGNPTGTAPSGERPPLTAFSAGQPAPVPAPESPAATTQPSPMAAPQAANTNTPNPLASNGEYRAAYDPVFLGIQQAIQQDPTRLAKDPEFMRSVTKARNDRIEQLRQQYGNMVNFTGVL